MGIYGFIPLLWLSASQLPTAATRASALATFLNFQIFLGFSIIPPIPTRTDHLPTASDVALDLVEKPFKRKTIN